MINIRPVLGLATILGVLITTCAGTQTTFGGVEFPQGISSFADRVEVNNVHISASGQPTAPHRDATRALGAPDYAGATCTLATCTYIALGVGGSITLEFVDNRLTGSGSPALDLWVFEIGPQVEDTFVEVSKDGVTYTAVGKRKTNGTGSILCPDIARSSSRNLCGASARHPCAIGPPSHPQ